MRPSLRDMTAGIAGDRQDSADQVGAAVCGIQEVETDAIEFEQEEEETAESQATGPLAWAGIELLASRLQAVPYAASFLSKCTILLLRLVRNKVSLKSASSYFL